MPRVHPRQFCRICKRHRDEVGDLSARGKCQECADAMIRGNIEGLKTSSGPFFEYWRYRCADTFRYVLLEDDRPPTR